MTQQQQQQDFTHSTSSSRAAYQTLHTLDSWLPATATFNCI
jgi:hypothetical protein